MSDESFSLGRAKASQTPMLGAWIKRDGLDRREVRFAVFADNQEKTQMVACFRFKQAALSLAKGFAGKGVVASVRRITGKQAKALAKFPWICRCSLPGEEVLR